MSKNIPQKKKIYLSLLHILHLSNAFQRIIYPILRFLFLLQALARHEYSSKMPQIRHFLVTYHFIHISYPTPTNTRKYKPKPIESTIEPLQCLQPVCFQPFFPNTFCIYLLSSSVPAANPLLYKKTYKKINKICHVTSLNLYNNGTLMTLDMPPPMPKYVTLLPPNVCQITIICVTLLHTTRYIYTSRY